MEAASGRNKRTGAMASSVAFLSSVLTISELFILQKVHGMNPQFTGYRVQVNFGPFSHDGVVMLL